MKRVIAIQDLETSVTLYWIGEAEDTVDAFRKFQAVSPEIADFCAGTRGDFLSYSEVWGDRAWNQLRVAEGTPGSNNFKSGDAIPDSWLIHNHLEYGKPMPQSFQEMTLERQTMLLRHRTGGMSRQALTSDMDTSRGILVGSERMRQERDETARRNERLE